MAITAQTSAYSRLGEVVVTDWKAASLLKPSTVKPILTTIQKSLIIRTLGRFSERDLQALQDALRTLIG